MRHLKKFNESNLTKLPYEKWLEKYFDCDRDHNYCTSNYERTDIGFAPSDLSRYREEDLQEEYQHYLNDTNDFLKYDEDECTNANVED